MDEALKKLRESVQRLEQSGVDLIAYCGPITIGGYHEVCDILEQKSNEKVILFLCTFGGDPNAGYRIARAITHHYGTDNFSIAIPTDCKSAGTLVCIAARELIFFNKGELGPLDTQIFKQDEIFQRSSGLDLLRGMSYLNSEASKLFQNYLHDISRLGGISTKSASEIAVNMVKGLYTPMYAQIDPLRLGEMQAALQIAFEYGTRLNDKSKSLKQDGLTRLIHEYPTHGFAIDRAEARMLFKCVNPPSEDVRTIGDLVANVIWNDGFIPRPKIFNLTKDFTQSNNGGSTDEHHGDGVAKDIEKSEDSDEPES